MRCRFRVSYSAFEMLPGNLVRHLTFLTLVRWSIKLQLASIDLIKTFTLTGMASLPMQTAPSALALIVRFTYFQVANTLK